MMKAKKIETVTFIMERDEALLSLDKEKILKYCKKYRVPTPENEIAFWAGVHKAILRLKSATEGQRSRSLKWLEEHGVKVK